MLLAGLLAFLPVFTVGLYGDDYVHRAVEKRVLPAYERGVTQLYAFTSSDQAEMAAARSFGGMPWFTADDLSLRFFRPIPSALLVLEMRLFGDSLWPARLHTFLWFAALLLVATALFRRCLSPPAAAVAALVYALSVVHTTGLAWLAARYAIIAAALGLASLLAHLRAREDGWRPGAVLAPLLLVVAYLCGESAIAAAGMIFFYELTARRRSVGQRIVALLPATLVTLVYVGWYETAGYGVAGSGVYVDPLGEPLRFLAAAAWRVPALIGNMLAAVPSELSFPVPAARAVLAAIGAVGAVGFGLLAWRLWHRMEHREHRALTWMIPAALAGTLLFSSGPPGGRMLPIVFLGFAALIGVVVVRAWQAAAERGGTRRKRIAWRTAAVGIGTLHLALSPLVRVSMTKAIADQGKAAQTLSRTMAEVCAPEMYLPAASDSTVFHYAPAAALLDGKAPPRSLRVLSMAPQDHRIENVRATGFDLVTVGPRRIGTWERVFRSDPLRAGDEVTLPGLDVRVVEVERGWPTRIRVDFGKPLSSPDLCFVDYRDGAFVEMEPPHPGETVELHREIGPTGM